MKNNSHFFLQMRSMRLTMHVFALCSLSKFTRKCQTLLPMPGFVVE
jgi:hypothetical protein